MKLQRAKFYSQKKSTDRQTVLILNYLKGYDWVASRAIFKSWQVKLNYSFT